MVYYKSIEAWRARKSSCLVCLSLGCTERHWSAAWQWGGEFGRRVTIIMPNWPCSSWQEWELQSPLHIAAYSGNVAKLEELLKTCESTSLPNSFIALPTDKTTAFHVGDVDLVEEFGRTPLMYSAMAEREECVVALLRHGALITLQDSSGQTALHWAALTVSWLSVWVVGMATALIVWSTPVGKLQVFEGAACTEPWDQDQGWWWQVRITHCRPVVCAVTTLVYSLTIQCSLCRTPLHLATSHSSSKVSGPHSNILLMWAGPLVTYTVFGSHRA